MKEKEKSFGDGIETTIAYLFVALLIFVLGIGVGLPKEKGVRDFIKCYEYSDVDTCRHYLED